MMANSTYGVRSLGDYVVGRRLGFGSYSVVWHARHKVLGTEVAIKEILTARLDRKLEECLMSEIDILRNINHPNIIRLHDMIKEPGKIHLVLEYCEGGDLSRFIHRRQGRIPESTAVHFMKQLAAGLKILQENQIIHRDLKPQNLLLCTNEGNSTLKIADFGFARYLQSRGLAETLCGSPLYMAPEIMQFQKYDAKADLWSVGAILFQVVTGRTPFAGINQIQLLQNIMKSTELQFPPNAKDLSSDCMDLCRKLLRQNPVERLTFEEFFSHPFFTRQPVELSRQAQQRNMKPLRPIDGFTSPESAASKSKGGSQDDGGHDGCPTAAGRSPLISFTVVDSSELIDEDYVIVSGPLGDSSFSLASVSKLSQLTSASGIPPLTYRNIHSTSSAPLSINGGTTSKMGCSGSSESRCPAPSGTPHESVNIVDASEQPSTDMMEMIKSLKHFSSAITELVYEKIEAGQQLEAFSIQLVNLAIWKQALDICRTQAASAIEASPSQETTRLKESTSKDHRSPDIQECLETAKSLQYVCCLIERIFLGEVENAEELAKVIEPGNVGMPDPMEAIFQAALTFGKHGAVDECLGYLESASTLYSKAVCLLSFLLVVAPSLALNPPFSITKSDSYRLRTYIDVLSNRQRYSTSQCMALLNTDDTILPNILHC